MLFSSREFIFYFLPAVLVLFHVTRLAIGGRAAMRLLMAASIFFYGWWNPPYLALLLGSVIGNYMVARVLEKRPDGWILGLAVAANLAVIGYFKYRGFFLENVGLLIGEDWNIGAVFVPLAISFFTFQQIALLIDIRDGKAKLRSPLDYGLFICFFPQLIAGPIVLFREMDKQLLATAKGEGEGASMLGAGLVIFALGLFKKIVLADSIGTYADVAFGRVELLTFLEAWLGAIAYSLQLYFDFSGYSDMAVGLGLMFGFRLPVNFNTPFRATSMIDFWKRWHMTMTRFFMMYLYSPVALALTRISMERGLSGAMEFALAVAIPITFTFLMSGLWHGAAWTFICFGAVNAVGLLANHAWKKAKLPALPGVLGWLLTMLTVVVSFVYFRAESLGDAHHMLRLMAAPWEIILPNWLAGPADALGLPWQTLSFLNTGSYTLRLMAWIVLLLPLSLLLPNPATKPDAILPNWRLAAGTAVMLLLAIGLIDRPQAFIYFQF